MVLHVCVVQLKHMVIFIEDWKDSWFGEKKGVGRKVLLEKLANFIV